MLSWRHCESRVGQQWQSLGREDAKDRRQVERQATPAAPELDAAIQGVHSGLTAPSQTGGNSGPVCSFVVRTNFECERQRRPPFLSGVSLTASVSGSCGCAWAGGGRLLTHRIAGSLFAPDIATTGCQPGCGCGRAGCLQATLSTRLSVSLPGWAHSPA